MTFDPVTIAVFLLAVALMGLAKGGLSGIGLMAMPLLILVMPAPAAAGLLLPVLMIQDGFGLWLYRGRWDWPNLRLLLPAACVGIVIGLSLYAVLPQRWMLGILGAVTLVFAIRGLLTPAAPARTPHPAVGISLGILSGFTSTVLHQGGPPFQIYLLPQRLPRDVFVGTSMVFFAVVNWIKLPGFIALGQLTGQDLLVALAATPFALLMTWLGTRLVRSLDPERFYVIIYWLLALVGLKLLADGVL